MDQIQFNQSDRETYRAFRTAARLAGVRSVDQLEDLMRDIGKTIANELMRADIPVETPRFRPDVGHVQIDNCIVTERVTKPHPVIRLQFEVAGHMGVDFKIKLVEFLQDPAGYVRDLFAHLGPMRRNTLKMREHKRQVNDAVYRATTGAAHG